MGEGLNDNTYEDIIKQSGVGLVSLFYEHFFPAGERCLNDGESCVIPMGMCDVVLKYLRMYSVPEIINIIQEKQKEFDITPSDIPQFSNYEDAVYKVPYLTVASGLTDISFTQMGFMLINTPKKDGAYMKYGENHAKMAAQMGLCNVQKGKINLSYFGCLYSKLSKEEQAEMVPKLLLYMPLIHNFFASGMDKDLLNKYFSTLSESTQKRRMSNVRTIINYVGKYIDYEF